MPEPVDLTEKVKVGDPIILHNRNGMIATRITQVSSVFTNHIETENTAGAAFDRWGVQLDRQGNPLPNTYWLRIPEPHEEETIKNKLFAQDCEKRFRGCVDFDKIPVPIIKQMIALIPEEAKCGGWKGQDPRMSI